VLLVDADSVSRRFVERAVSAHAPDLAVEPAIDGAAALALLVRRSIDVVVCESELPDMTGLRLHRLMRQQSRLKDVPFAILSADDRTAAKVAALRAGIDDYLAKPCDPQELAARLESLASRCRRQRELSVANASKLSGETASVPLADLVMWLGKGKHTGTLCIAVGQMLGEISVAEGRLVHAAFGGLLGEEAFFALASAAAVEPRGRFELTDERWTLTATINASTPALLAEASRRAQQARLAAAPAPALGPPAAIGAARLPAAPPAAAGAPADLAARSERWSAEPADLALAPARDAALADRLARGLETPFVVGELCLYDARDLNRWCRSTTGSVRFHVLVVCEPGAGVSGLLSLAAEPTEGWVLDSLRGDPKALGLTFFLRGDHLVDLVLVDARNPRLFRDVLVRQPAVAIVAPSAGSVGQEGAKARVGLDRLLSRVCPQVVAAVGDAAADESLRELSVLRQGQSELVLLAGGSSVGGDAAAELRGDLRRILVEAVRRWGRPRPAAAPAPAAAAERA
jgi:CheY-like chemotaxis protein